LSFLEVNMIASEADLSIRSALKYWKVSFILLE